MNAEQLKDVRRRLAHFDRWRARKFGKGRCSYLPADLPKSMQPGGRNAVPTNDELSAVELEDFMASAAAPCRWFGYLAKCVPTGEYVVTTFDGALLARIAPHRITFRTNPRGVTSRVRGTFRARGINGIEYVGTHNGEGMYCRMRPAATTRNNPTRKP